LRARRSRSTASISSTRSASRWIIVTWGVIPLLVVIGVPLLLQLVAIFTGMGIAAYAAFVKFPPRIEAANDDIRRRRYVPPPRREERSRPKPTPAGRRRRHR
jgi:hypothetical protein